MRNATKYFFKKVLEDILNRIKEFRKKKNLSQSDVARLMKVKQNTISQWENDVRIPNIKQCIKLASIFKTTVENLYKWKY